MSLYPGLRPLSLTRVLGTLLLSLSLVCLLDRLAYAQAVAGVPPGPLTAFTPASLFISIGGALVAALSQGYNTGTLFGQQVPKPWLPYLGYVGTFLAATVQSMAATTQTGALGWYNAVMVGFFALVGPTVGVTAVQHLFAHKGGGGSASPTSEAGPPKDPVTVAAAKLSPPSSSRLGGFALGLVVLVAMLMQSGCLSSAPIVPVTPANTAQVSSCENTATLHDGFVIGDFALGGAAAALGGTAAAVPSSNASAQEGLAISAAVAGAGAVVLTALSEYTASNFANGNCPSVVGPLPAAAPAATVAK